MIGNNQHVEFKTVEFKTAITSHSQSLKCRYQIKQSFYIQKETIIQDLKVSDMQEKGV